MRGAQDVAARLGAPYERCAPQAVLALALGNLVAWPTASATDPALLALYNEPLLLAASALVGSTAGDAKATHHLGRFYAGIVRVAESGGRVEIMAADRGGVKMALERLIRDATERDDAPAIATAPAAVAPEAAAAPAPAPESSS